MFACTLTGILGLISGCITHLDMLQIAELAKNSFRASFLPDEVKAHYYELVDAQLAIFSAHIDKLTNVGQD